MEQAQSLLERAQRWDQAALAQVYDSYAPAIYRYAYRRTGHIELAHDITAETFHRFLVALQHGNGPRVHLSAWLYRVAHNLIVDTYRRSPPQEPVPLDDVDVADTSDHEEDLERREEIARARVALRRLTPLQQQVIALRFLEDMSLEDVALTIDRTVGAVKSLQHRALNSLRRILEERDES
jgi:RNA polymerase sigma-70 factor (ECF subfamily)